MNRYSRSVILMFFCTGCNGGGDGVEKFLEGRWSGEIFQESGIRCSDGTFIGAGLGTPGGEWELDVVGGDAVGDPVSVTDTRNDHVCVYDGVRGTESEVTVTSEDPECFEGVVISNVHGDLAHFSSNPRTPIASEDGSVNCSGVYGGDLMREDSGN